MHAEIAGIRIAQEDASSLERILRDVLARPCPGQSLFQIVTLNPIIFAQALRDRRVYSALREADLVIPEAVGLALIGWLFGRGFVRTRGIDLFEQILALAEVLNQRVYFIGAHEEVIARAAERLQQKFPRLVVAGFHHGYFKPEEEPVVLRKIVQSRADIVFAGFSTPRQELWIAGRKRSLNAKMAVGVGGSFDVFSSRLKAAPVFMRTLGLEWLFRTLQEPWRIKRIIRIPVFLCAMLLFRFRLYTFPSLKKP